MSSTGDSGFDRSDGRSVVPGFADPDTEELQQRRPGTGHFDQAMRGYERSQVDNYLAQVRWTIEELRKELGASQEQARVASLEVKRLNAELERGRPDAEVIGGRIGKILALAEAEAEQVRQEAATAIEGVSAERTRIIEDAQAHAESLVVDARRHVAQLTDDARNEARQVTEGAREEAKKVTDSAREGARRITEAAQQDLDALVNRRAAIVNDLQRAHQHLGQVLAESNEHGAGPRTQSLVQQQPQRQPQQAGERTVIQLPNGASR